MIAGGDAVLAGVAGSVGVPHRLDVGVHVGHERCKDLRRLTLLDLQLDVGAGDDNPVQHVFGCGQARPAVLGERHLLPFGFAALRGQCSCVGDDVVRIVRGGHPLGHHERHAVGLVQLAAWGDVAAVELRQILAGGVVEAVGLPPVVLGVRDSQRGLGVFGFVEEAEYRLALDVP